MSIDKFTSRGFGARGAHGRSSWSAPRESYKAPAEGGSNFLFGGSGLRGGPASGAQHRPLPSGASAGLSSEATRLNDDRHGSTRFKDDGNEGPRSFDLSGGDSTTTKFERIAILGGIFVAAVLFSFLIRAISGGSSDTSWVQERRALINPDDEE